MGIITPEAVGKLWTAAKPFQVEDAEFGAAQGSIVWGHRTGLGKTFISLMALSKWKDANKILIVGTLSSMAQWSRIMGEWVGIAPIFMQGGGDPDWKAFLKCTSGVYMCTYPTFRMLMKATQGRVGMDVLIEDELHRMMRSRGTQIYSATLRADFNHYMGLSATWASRGPQDLWPVLHLINKRTFPSYWRFVDTFCFTEVGTFGKEIFGVRNPEALRTMLHSRYLRMRTWGEVGRQFRDSDDDPVIRRVVKVPMSRQQKKFLADLDTEMMVDFEGERVITPSSLAMLTRSLQIAISPRTLMEGPKVELGAPIEWLLERIEQDPHTVVFCPFKSGLDVLQQALIKGGYDRGIYNLRGGIRSDKINDIVAAWKSEKGLMLCTIDFAQSFDLDTTDTAYMLGFDWDPNDNMQAEGRLRRLDSIIQSPCLVRYIIPEGSCYEAVQEVVNGKVVNTKQFLYNRLALKK